jgi:AcrR family transcriptional regulator
MTDSPAPSHVPPARRGRPVDIAGREAKARAILEAAASVFARDGFHKASTNDICRAAGISSAGLYQYFASKEALILAIAEEHRRRDLRRTAALRDGPILAAIARAAECAGPAEDPFDDGRLVLEIFAESARNPALREVLARAERDVLALLGQIAAEAQAAGDLRPDIAPDDAAQLMRCLFDGFYCRGFAGEPGAALRPVLGFLRAALAPAT